MFKIIINSCFRAIAEHDLPSSIPEVENDSSHSKVQEKRVRCKGIRNGWSRFVRVFDLGKVSIIFCNHNTNIGSKLLFASGLLKDWTYLNIMLGISLAVFAEINFSLLTPFILNEFHYSTEQIAIFMSVLAVADIVCRFASPFIGDYLKQPARIMYMYALCLLIIMRTSLLFVSSYRGILIVAFLGLHYIIYFRYFDRCYGSRIGKRCKIGIHAVSCPELCTPW